MPLINYVTHDGNTYEADVPVGQNVMNGAVENMIDGIEGQCGGYMSCGTCHCFVDEEWLEKTGVAEGTELDLLQAVTDPQPNSRLSCQIAVTSDLDGLTVHLPESQF